jgi:bifunctional UDP-N-acetylglucosamine pyrophosphorylase/glucosamine-1-phosphate N-acetyltransferase
MAAGLGKRLRPLTERFAKPVLPIDGRPVIVALLHELARAGLNRVTVVTGHLAEQVETLLAVAPVDVRFVRQPEPRGSADAVRRAEPRAPAVIVAADTLFAPGAIGAFLAGGAGTAGAVAIRSTPPKPGQTRIRVEDGRVVRFGDDDPENHVTGAPLWLFGEPALRELDRLSGPPFELAEALQRLADNGEEIRAVPVGRTRDLTDPLDLVRENFPYLRGLE